MNKSLKSFDWQSWLPTRGNILFTILVVAILISTQSVWAKNSNAVLNVGANAATINYQGKLADNAGAPLNGIYNITFSIYDSLTGGTALWNENHTNVSISNGMFSIGLGGLTPGGIPLNLWGSDRYLEISVNGEALSPRETIRSVPMAGMALTVPNGAINTDQIADGAVKLTKLGSDVNTMSIPGLMDTEKLADGAANGFWYTIGTTNTTTNLFTSTYTPQTLIPQMTLNVPTKGGKIEINFETGFILSGAGFVIFAIRVDDVEMVKHAARVFQANESTSTHLMWVVDNLPAGTHKIEVYWGVSASGITAGINSATNPWEKRVLTVHEYRR